MIIRIKWILVIIAMAGVLGSMAYAADDSPPPQPSAEAIQIPDLVATVNGVNIIRQDLERRISQSRAMDPERFDAMSLEQRKSAIIRTIDQMILREIIYQEAVNRGIVVSDEVVDFKLDELKMQFPSEDVFKQAFADAGITIPAWKDDTRMTLMGMKLEEMVVDEIQISDGEIAEYYEKNKATLDKDAVKVSHIMVKTEKDAKKVVKEFKKKKDFAGLAKKYSTDALTKDKGGELGWYARGELLEDAEKAAYSLSPGQISKPVKGDNGWHVIRLDEKTLASEQTIEDHREHVRAILRQVKWQQLKSTWVSGLQALATVWRWSP